MRNACYLRKSARHNRILGIGLVLGLVIGLAGCVSPRSTSVPVSGVAACDATRVRVTDVHWFTDSGGAWRVVGVIENGSSVAISKVVTGVETYRKDDQPADQGEDISAYPEYLQPGSQAPFTAWIDRSIPGLDHFAVEVDECVPADLVARGRVDIRAGQVIVDGAGRAEVTAELYNPGVQPVLVNGLMAAVYDRSGGILTAQYVDVASRHLEPGTSGPVRATLDLPPGSEGQVAAYKIFLDAVIDQAASLPLDVQQDVHILSRYTDDAGKFHLVGTITNPGTTGLMTSLQAAVYSDSNRTALVDAAELTTWIPLLPGEILPFDLHDWGSLENTPSLWDQLGSQDPVVDLRFEPFLTWTTRANVVRLSLKEACVLFEGRQVIFSGKAVNDMGGSLLNGLVTAAVRLRSSGEIMAAGSVHLDLTNPADPGEGWEYRVVIPLPPGVDPSAVDTEVLAQGQLP